MVAIPAETGIQGRLPEPLLGSGFRRSDGWGI